MVFYKDEMHPPSWLDGAFLEKVLRKSENDPYLSVSECTFSPGSSAGDHIMSAILRATVKYQSREKPCEISLIIKTIPDEPGQRRDILLHHAPLFDTETVVYQNVVPEMERVLRTIGAKTEFGPRLLHSSKDPTLIMVFDDLTKRDYVTKSSQLNLHEAKIAYTKMARWHAASMFLADTVPAIKAPNKGHAIMAEYANAKWAACIAMLAKLCQNWPGYGIYSEYLEKFKKSFSKRILDIYTPQESDLFNVFNHGDFHFKNMMFKTLDGKTTDILLLDYQICAWGSPAIDIIYSLYTALSVETRDNHRDELIKFYHDELVSVLTKLGYQKKIPSLIELHVELLKCGPLEPFWAFTLLPHMLVPMSELTGIQKDIQNGVDLADVEMLRKIKLALFQHPKYTSVIKRYLPVFLYKGLLD